MRHVFTSNRDNSPDSAFDLKAKFAYDLSPIAVSYRKSSRKWYDYATSLFAIIGGVFTVVGLIESSLEATISKSRRLSRNF